MGSVLASDLHTWDLNIWKFSEKELLQFAAQLLDEAGVLSAFAVSHITLASFLNAACNQYHPNPYHNFQHAISVLHVCSLLLNAGLSDKLTTPFTKLHTFALFIAAIGHDIDHPGVSNAFLVHSSAPLALLYNDESVLENHHAASTFSLLANKGNDLSTNLSLDERKQFRHLICKSIIATDMAHHADAVKSITAMAAESKPIEPLDVLTTFLHLADLSNPVLDFKLSKRWAHLVCKEFREQATRERTLGLPVAPHLANLDGPADVAKLQLGFIDFVVLPLWNAAALLFPGAKSRISQLETNRTEWAREKEEAISNSKQRRRRSQDGGQTAAAAEQHEALKTAAENTARRFSETDIGDLAAELEADLPSQVQPRAS